MMSLFLACGGTLVLLPLIPLSLLLSHHVLLRLIPSSFSLYQLVIRPRIPASFSLLSVCTHPKPWHCSDIVLVLLWDCSGTVLAIGNRLSAQAVLPPQTCPVAWLPLCTVAIVAMRTDEHEQMDASIAELAAGIEVHRTHKNGRRKLLKKKPANHARLERGAEEAAGGDAVAGEEAMCGESGGGGAVGEEAVGGEAAGGEAVCGEAAGEEAVVGKEIIPK